MDDATLPDGETIGMPRAFLCNGRYIEAFACLDREAGGEHFYGVFFAGRVG